MYKSETIYFRAFKIYFYQHFDVEFEITYQLHQREGFSMIVRKHEQHLLACGKYSKALNGLQIKSTFQIWSSNCLQIFISPPWLQRKGLLF